MPTVVPAALNSRLPFRGERQTQAAARTAGTVKCFSDRGGGITLVSVSDRYRPLPGKPLIGGLDRCGEGA